MLSNNQSINNLKYDSMVEKLAKINKISINEARHTLSALSFKQYLNLLEASADITPPSGNKVGGVKTAPMPMQQQSQPTSTIKPTSQPTTAITPSQQAQSQKQNMWTGGGASIENGMTAGIKDQTGKVNPVEILQVDNNANGVRVRNSTTGKEEWYNKDNLEAMSQGPMSEDIKRIQALAGINIQENASSGCTSAGSIAIAPTSMGKPIKRKQEVDESPSLEHPKAGNTLIAGDQRTGRAMGRLSANLAVKGQKTASRKNNGKRR